MCTMFCRTGLDVKVENLLVLKVVARHQLIVVIDCTDPYCLSSLPLLHLDEDNKEQLILKSTSLYEIVKALCLGLLHNEKHPI